MDWAAMVMQMYKMWAQRRGFKVMVMEEMPGEIAGIKVHSHCNFDYRFHHCNISYK